MWKAPNRPKHEISQSFNDGIISIYEVKNIARPGYKPEQGLKFKKKLRYTERRVGINRFYYAAQNQIKIERILRVAKVRDISTQDIVITESGEQYEIHQIQTVRDSYPACVDISLSMVKQKYEVK